MHAPDRSIGVSGSGGEAKIVRVTPGSFPDTAGMQSALQLGRSYAKHVFYTAAYSSAAQYDLVAEQNDYAVIRLHRPLGDSAGFRGYASLAKAQGSNMRAIAYRPYVCNLAGPSCNKSTELLEMYEVEGRVGPLHDGVLFDSIMDGVKGSSGAGITADGLDRDTIFAIEISEHDVPVPYNSSLMLRPAIVANIRKWASVVIP